MTDRVFIESRIFTRLLGEYLTDVEYAELQQFLLQRPTAGAVIQHSGGVRKLRWAAKGKGKRGGVRVIYCLDEEMAIWMLTIYSKSEAATIPASILRQIREAMQDE